MVLDHQGIGLLHHQQQEGRHDRHNRGDTYIFMSSVVCPVRKYDIQSSAQDPNNDRLEYRGHNHYPSSYIKNRTT
jgi:hypothetical protein